MLFRAASRTLTVARAYGRRQASLQPNPAAAKEFMAQIQAEEEHAAHTTDLWRKISLYVALPACVLCAAWVWNVEAEHAAHAEHIKAENGGVRPDPPEYSYLNRRIKPYPWGMNSLFFNPEVQKDMSQAEGE